MKSFRYVLYGKINVRLSTFLHIGGDDEENFSLACDGGGKYIIPASGIAGAVKAYLKEKPEELRVYAGDAQNESRIFYYDAPCKNVNIEERNGIRIDGRYGVCHSGALYTQCVIGQGMEADIKMQIFTGDSDRGRRDIEKVFDEIAAGVGSGAITFGAYKSVGSGIFEVLKSGRRVLDLCDEKEFEEYVSGVEKVMAKVPETDAFSLKEADGRTCFRLTAELPHGILVGGGEPESDSDAANVSKSVFDAANVSESGDLYYKPETIYYIPGTTIKGYIRGYAKRIENTFEIPQETLFKIFGGEYGGKKYRSHLATSDVLLDRVEIRIFDRIKINSWLGGVVGSAKMDYEALFTENVTVSVSTDMQDTEEGRLLNAFVFLALRDLGLGLEAIGSRGSVGLGKFKGRSLEVAGYCANFADGKLEFEKDAQEMIKRWLKEVEKYADRANRNF